MGQMIELTAADGHRLAAYEARPAGTPRGGIVVIQEIFGVTSHIRAVADQYAAEGWLAVAPALFDRLQRNVDFPYTDLAPGYKLMLESKPENALADIGAAVKHASQAGKVGVVGYCWGGQLAWRAAGALPIAAAVAYYGGGIHTALDTLPKCPVMFHYGERDTHIPMETIEPVRKAYPAGQYFFYPAGHGFNCTDRADYEPASARLAFERSATFLHQHVG